MKNIIIMWPGTNGNIPSGYLRETGLDSKFLKGSAASTDPNTTGGADTHAHTSPPHYHNVVDHGHYVETSYADHTDCIDKAPSGGGPGGTGSHRHTGTIYGTSGSTSSVAVTYGAASNNPPYHELIFMKSNSIKAVPANGIILWAGASLPTGFSLCDGNNGTPDLRNKYVRGAASAGDAGGTGGSFTNVHDITHGHTASHSHSYPTSVREGGSSTAGSGNGGESPINHQHQITLNSRSDTIVNYSGSLTTGETVEPAYKKLAFIKNTSGSAKMPVGAIALWLGSLATIPVGWNLCDGGNGTPDMRSLYVKGANDLTEIGNTGGSNTHTHAAQPHGHSVSNASHTHGYSIGTHPCGPGHGGASQCTWRCSMGQPHSSLTRQDAANVSYSDANTTADSSNNEPSHRTVAYIQFSYEAGSAIMIPALS